MLCYYLIYMQDERTHLACMTTLIVHPDCLELLGTGLVSCHDEVISYCRKTVKERKISLQSGVCLKPACFTGWDKTVDNCRHDTKKGNLI